MVTILLIRHGKTKGNLTRNYIGSTDEDLCDIGRKEIQDRSCDYPRADRIYTSPMLRCRQTAALIYPYQQPTVIEELKECDFGLFEGKNYKQLSKLKEYQAWVDSNGTLPFPNGEDRYEFALRCERAARALFEREHGRIALVVHGGTIMSIMSAMAKEKRDFYEWSVENGGGYLLQYENKELTIIKEFK